jgi:DNA-binding transcriptional regulator YbjK
MATRQSSDTRARILATARELFARKGYPGTSISDIADELGTTTAALYYHFSSKAEILDALFDEPLAAYARFVERASTGRPTPSEVLDAVIDMTVDSGGLVPVLDAVIGALAGPDPDHGTTIAAHAAYAVVKEGCRLLETNGPISLEDRAELRAAALRALDRPAATAE